MVFLFFYFLKKKKKKRTSLKNIAFQKSKQELAKNKDRQEYLRKYLEKNNPNPKITEAMNRTFGEYLEFIDPRILLKDADEKAFGQFFNFGMYEAIRTFIDKVDDQN